MGGRRTVDVSPSLYRYHASVLVVPISTVPKPEEVNNLDTNVAPSATNLQLPVLFCFPVTFCAVADGSRSALSGAGSGRALCWGCSQVPLTVKFFLTLSFLSLFLASLFSLQHKMIRETLSKQERLSFIRKSELCPPPSCIHT